MREREIEGSIEAYLSHVYRLCLSRVSDAEKCCSALERELQWLISRLRSKKGSMVILSYLQIAHVTRLS